MTMLRRSCGSGQPGFAIVARCIRIILCLELLQSAAASRVPMLQENPAEGFAGVSFRPAIFCLKPLLPG
jgi:hypothetical protein